MTREVRDKYDLERWEKDLNEREAGMNVVRFVIKIAVGLLVLLLALWALFALVGPQITLYRTSTTKRAQIAEARAKADAAVELARAEVERARGVAEANKIVAASITEEYLRYLYIDQLDQVQGQVIYVPTEAGLPILEAGKRATEGQQGG